MSDGPFRSLPLKRHWKKFAERAETLSYSLEEVAAAFPGALINDFKDAPLDQVRNIILGNGQIPLFPRDCANQLEELRGTCCGSTVGNMFIDCAIEAIAIGLTGESAINATVKNALEAFGRGRINQIEEHYRRKQPGSELNIRNRMNAAREQVLLDSLASEMASGNGGSRGKLQIMKQTGIDEGPRL